MAERDAIIEFLDDLLDSAAFEDYGPNGLQVPGADEVVKVVTAVSAHQELFERAAATGAQMILCHHGIFWGGGLGPIDARNDHVVFTPGQLPLQPRWTFDLVLAPSLSNSLRNAVPHMILAELCSETVVCKHRSHRPSHPDQIQIDVAFGELLAEGLQHVSTCCFHLVCRLEIQDQRLDPLSGIDLLKDRILHLDGINPEQRHVDAEHEDFRYGCPFRMLPNTTPSGLFARHLAEDLNIHPARSVHQTEQ